MFERLGPWLRPLSMRLEPSRRRYPRHMVTVSASDVAAELRARLSPNLGDKKLHKLLYYCQGHHLASFGEPLFRESVSAWDMGPVVGALWHQEKLGDPARPSTALSEAQLNTIGYVVSRYGRLTGRDLEHLSHGEEPWRQADKSRPPQGSVRIEPEWMASYFSSADSDDDEPRIPPDEVSAWLRGADARRPGPASPDSLEEIRSRLTTHG